MKLVEKVEREGIHADAALPTAYPVVSPSHGPDSPHPRRAMTRLSSALALFLAAAPLGAQSFFFDETLRGGGSDDDSGQDVALAADGSRYVTGAFEGVAAFGDASIRSVGELDAFFVKYGPGGEALWARRGGTGGADDYGTAVAAAPDGGVYAAGTFTGNATFDGGTNPDVLLFSFGSYDTFLARYSPDGDLQWIRQGGGSALDTSRDLALDADGNVYLAGSFTDAATFGGATLDGDGRSDLLLVKYAPDGAVLWARGGGSSQADLARGVAVGPNGHPYLAGVFEGTVSLGGSAVQSLGGSDVFVLQWTPDGDPVWFSRLGAEGDDGMRNGGIGLGADGTVYVQGSFSTSITIGGDLLTSTGPTDIFLAKLDRDGNAVWGRRGGSDGGDAPAALSVFGSGILITGYTEGTGSFADTPITTQSRDGYFAVFDAEGELFLVKLFGGPGRDAGTGLASDLASSRFVLAGQFQDTASFDALTLTSAGRNDAFVVGGRFGAVDLEPGGSAPPEHALGVPFPNPFSRRTALALDVAEAQTVTVEVFDVLGQRVAVLHDGPLTAGSHRLVLEPGGLPTGMYVVRAVGEAFRLTRTATLVR